ncbi:MAG: cupin domain-containing protein [Alphaproteobacteria bacterium]|nr:cupin domain-containing protein [Alphaproteobacteria bacterium]
MPEMIKREKFAQPVNDDKVAQSWRERGYSCHHFTDPPGQEWNGFVHATNELVTVLEGKLELTIGDARCAAGPGDEVFIPRDVVHSVKNIYTGTTRWMFGYD